MAYASSGKWQQLNATLEKKIILTDLHSLYTGF